MKYVVEGGTAEFGTDVVLDLTKEQVAARVHSLEKVAGGWRPTAIVQFKAGETVGVNVNPDKLSGRLGEVLKPGGAKTTVAKLRAERPKGARRQAAKAAPAA